MNILDKKEKIQSIINVFETGSLKGDYKNISIYNDGPNGAKQVTYGKSQTTEYGNLKDLIKMYVENKGLVAERLQPYISKIGIIPLYNNKAFTNLLKEAGTDPIMISTQDVFFDKHYWTPAMKWCQDNKFTFPLAGLVIYDSYIHSGSILPFLRKRFVAKTPANGGDQQEWITQYLITRKEWLRTHTNIILRKTVYRVNNMITAVEKKDWMLESPFNANGLLVP